MFPPAPPLRQEGLEFVVIGPQIRALAEQGLEVFNRTGAQARNDRQLGWDRLGARLIGPRNEDLPFPYLLPAKEFANRRQ